MGRIGGKIKDLHSVKSRLCNIGNNVYPGGVAYTITAPNTNYWIWFFPLILPSLSLSLSLAPLREDLGIVYCISLSLDLSTPYLPLFLGCEWTWDFYVNHILDRDGRGLWTVPDRLISHFLLQTRTNLSNRLLVSFFLSFFVFQLSVRGVGVCVMSLMSGFRV